MRISHEAIYQSLFIQGRGAELPELVSGQTGRTSTSALLVGGDNDRATVIELPD